MPAPNTAKLTPDQQMLQSLRRHGLLEDIKGATFEVLTGGVSSDIWKVSADGRVYCVKRALSKLKVAADWFAPVERNRYQVAWYRIANRIMPGSAPEYWHMTTRPYFWRWINLIPKPINCGKANCAMGTRTPHRPPGPGVF